MKISAARKRTENRPHHNHFPLLAATQLEIKVGLTWREVDVVQNSLVDCIKLAVWWCCLHRAIFKFMIITLSLNQAYLSDYARS